MKIEAVTVCVNYSDFLVYTLPSIKNQFDRLVVVTDTKDVETKKLCDISKVDCVQTDSFYEEGHSFNKGKGINEGLKRLSLDGWVVHLDSDIYVPPQTRSILRNLPLQKNKIYGVDRLMCPGYKEWINFTRNKKHIYPSNVAVQGDVFPLGFRLADYKTVGGGYMPLGYFQMWHPETSGIKRYPSEHGFADKTDLLHCKKWPREKRELIPEVFVVHLESEVGRGLNWKGRVSPQFGPQNVSPKL